MGQILIPAFSAYYCQLQQYLMRTVVQITNQIMHRKHTASLLMMTMMLMMMMMMMTMMMMINRTASWS